MPQERIPLIPNQRSGLTPLAGASPVAMNTVIDQSGAVYRRPCLKAWHNTSTIDSEGIDGIHVTQGGTIYAVGGTYSGGGRTVYRITASAADEVGGANDAKDILGAKRPTFAETEALLAIAAGDAPQKVLLSTNQSSRLDNAPKSTHIVANSSRLLSNDIDNPGQIAYSDTASGGATAGHEVWGAGNGDAGLVTAESRPDDVRAVHENTGEVFGFGNSTVEVFSPDPQFVYSRAITREYGCSAPYGVIKRDQEFFWLDHRRRIVRSDGRNYEIWSDDIQASLDSMASVEGAYGYWVKTGPVDALVWTFPNGQTFVRQVDGAWSQWSAAGPAAFPVTAYHPTLLGTSSGRVATLSMDVQQDLGDRVHSYIQSGFINHGTDNKKRCRAVHVAVSTDTTTKEAVTPSDEAVATLRYRDDEGAWSNPLPLRLDDGPVVRFRSLGVYRRRDWRFTFTGTSKLVLAGVTEEYDVLGS